MEDLNLVLADIEVRLLESASGGTVYGVVATHPKTGKRGVMASGFASKRAAALDVRMLERKGYEDIEIVAVDDEDMPIEESSRSLRPSELSQMRPGDVVIINPSSREKMTFGGPSSKSGEGVRLVVQYHGGDRQRPPYNEGVMLVGAQGNIAMGRPGESATFWLYPKGGKIMFEAVRPYEPVRPTVVKEIQFTGDRERPTHMEDWDMPIEESSGKDVAMTIIKQMGGMGRLRAMVGAKDFVSYSAASESEYGEGLGGVAFKFAKSKGKPDYVKIILDPSDTYTVTFGSIRGYQLKNEDKTSGVYASNLRDLFERKTGLYLSL